MTRYEIIKSLPNFKQLIAVGLIPMQIFDWLTIYEHYLIERQTEGKMQAYTNTAELFKFSERQIMNLVKWMEN